MDDYGLRVRLRQEMCQDIAAACGQLALVTPPFAASTGAAPAPAPAAGPPADMEELVPSSAPPRGVAQGMRAFIAPHEALVVLVKNVF